MAKPAPWINRAYRLAEEIAWNTAKECARVEGGKRGDTFKARTIRHYDQHAATELGNLICERLGPPPGRAALTPQQKASDHD